MKKRGIELKINLSNKAIYTLIVVGILVIVGVGVWAYGTSSPSDFGHSLGEIDLPSCSDGQVLGIIGGSWDCVELEQSALKFKTIDIGDWNMDVNAQKVVSHGLSKGNIRSVNALIRDDNNLEYYDFAASQLVIDGDFVTYLKVGTTQISLIRDQDGLFDGNKFDSTSYNRGWVTIGYVD